MSAYILSVVPLDGHLTSFYYAPPDTVGIEFGTSCLRTVAVNRKCSGEPDGSYLLAGQIVRTKKKIQCKKVQTSKWSAPYIYSRHSKATAHKSGVPYQAARSTIPVGWVSSGTTSKK